MAQFGQSPLAKRISDIAGDINTQLSGGLPPDEQQVTRESPRPERWDKQREDRFVQFLMSAEGISELEARSRAKLIQRGERGLPAGFTPISGGSPGIGTFPQLPQVIPGMNQFMRFPGPQQGPITKAVDRMGVPSIPIDSGESIRQPGSPPFLPMRTSRYMPTAPGRVPLVTPSWQTRANPSPIDSLAGTPKKYLGDYGSSGSQLIRSNFGSRGSDPRYAARFAPDRLREMQMKGSSAWGAATEDFEDYKKTITDIFNDIDTNDPDTLKEGKELIAESMTELFIVPMSSEALEQARLFHVQLLNPRKSWHIEYDPKLEGLKSELMDNFNSIRDKSIVSRNIDQETTATRSAPGDPNIPTKLGFALGDPGIPTTEQSTEPWMITDPGRHLGKLPKYQQYDHYKAYSKQYQSSSQSAKNMYDEIEEYGIRYQYDIEARDPGSEFFATEGDPDRNYFEYVRRLLDPNDQSVTLWDSNRLRFELGKLDWSKGQSDLDAEALVKGGIRQDIPTDEAPTVAEPGLAGVQTSVSTRLSPYSMAEGPDETMKLIISAELKGKNPITQRSGWQQIRRDLLNWQRINPDKDMKREWSTRGFRWYGTPGFGT